jgi:hypothetical protein
MDMVHRDAKFVALPSHFLSAGPRYPEKKNKPRSMKRTGTLLTATSLLLAGSRAQCPFTPTIEPDDLILCPNEGGTLSTEPYDAYQWYKDGNPINGATAQTLPVSQMQDAGSSFTVAATSEGCTEMSASVLVDGWMFIPPYVIHGGDLPVSEGPVLEFCEGDTLTLTLASGYTENIVWYADGTPIPGENSPMLVITGTGSYTVNAAPDICPNYIQGIGVEVSATFLPTVRPNIVLDGEQLCVEPTGTSTQWYLDGQPAGNTDCITFTSSGPYTAFVDYGEPCQGLSDPWFATSVPEVPHAAPILSPVPTASGLTVRWPHDQPKGAWQLLDLTGRPLLTGVASPGSTTVLDLHFAAPGHYLLAPIDQGWKPQCVVVAR